MTCFGYGSKCEVKYVRQKVVIVPVVNFFELSKHIWACPKQFEPVQKSFGPIDGLAANFMAQRR